MTDTITELYLIPSKQDIYRFVRAGERCYEVWFLNSVSRGSYTQHIHARISGPLNMKDASTFARKHAHRYAYIKPYNPAKPSTYHTNR